ncbi:MAG: peptidoglycan DD-metalloendopeptidase family protein, partial [Caldilineales bacterium]|nr:peptidoglycan DD-metalloendopeptidase family protein [Caldilineales bacterium]
MFTSPPSNYTKSKLTKIIVFVVIVVLLVVGVWVRGGVWAGNEEKAGMVDSAFTFESPPASPFQHPYLAAETRTYIDSRLGFTFDYPSNWILQTGKMVDFNIPIWEVRIVAPHDYYAAIVINIIPSNVNNHYNFVNNHEQINYSVITTNKLNVSISVQEIGDNPEHQDISYISEELHNETISVFSLINSSFNIDNDVSIESAQIVSSIFPEDADSFRKPLDGGSEIFGYAGHPTFWNYYSDCFRTNIQNTFHLAEDWGASAETVVKAVANGVVDWYDSGYSNWPGRIVIVRHHLPDGSDIYSLYGHLSVVYVSAGQTVNKGDAIGTILYQPNNSHVHWEIRRLDRGPYPCSGTRPEGRGYHYPEHPNQMGFSDPSDFVASHGGGGSDTTPPSADSFSVSISGRTANLTTSGVRDNAGGSGVREVRFNAKYNGSWQGIGTDSSAPYSLNWDMCDAGAQDGDIEFGMEVWDNANNKWVWSEHHGNPHATKSYNCNPTAPGAPSLNSPGNGSFYPHNYDLTFIWNSTARAESYLIEWWGGPYQAMQPCGWQSGTSCHIGTVAPGHTYSWHVKARNGAGESGWSAAWNFTIQSQVQPPDIPTLRNPANGATLRPNDTVALEWNASARATEYAAEYRQLPSGGWRNSGHQPGTSWNIGQLPVGEYEWHVEAYNSAGWSNWSGAWRFTIQAERPSANFEAWPQNGSAPLNVSMHIISTANISSCSWNYGDGQTGSSCEGYHDHIYTASGIYTVRLSVSGPGGSDEMTRANYISVTSPQDTIPPSADNFSVSISDRTANLTTSGVRDNAGGSGVREVRFSAKYNGSWQGIGTDSSAPYSLNWDMCDAGVQDGDIEFGMEVWDNANNKWVWSEHHGNPHATKSYDCNPQPPNIPTLRNPANGATLRSDNAVNFEWNASERATEYAVEVWNTTTWQWYRSGMLSSLSWNAGSLPIGDYGWQVEAYNNAGWSGWSGEWRFTIIANRSPNAPSLLNPANGTALTSMPQLCWHNNGDPDGD